MTYNQILQITGLVIVGLSALSVGIFWGIKDDRKKLTDRQRKADALANMPSAVRQLHMEAERKITDFKLSFAIWVLSIIASFSLIYWLLK
jgi:hypothetical protein